LSPLSSKENFAEDPFPHDYKIGDRFIYAGMPAESMKKNVQIKDLTADTFPFQKGLEKTEGGRRIADTGKGHADEKNLFHFTPSFVFQWDLWMLRFPRNAGNTNG
jgi:hypothetical protein